MLLLESLPRLSTLNTPLLDSTLLAILISPVLYLIVQRPTTKHLVELRQAHAVLEENDARFRSLTQMSSGFYWETDTEHRLTQRAESNRESAESVFQQGSPIGRRRWEIPYLSPDESGWQAHRALLGAHRPFRDFEFSRLAADGAERHISISGDPGFDAEGNFKGYRGVGADITARKRADATLSASEAWTRTIAQSAHDAIITADSAGAVVSWNHGAEAIFGYAESEFVGQHLTRLMPERYRDGHLAGMNRIRSGGDSRVIGTVVELNGLRKDGSEFPLELSLAKWENTDGWFVTAIIRDITERKQAEDALRASDARLSMALEAMQIGIWDWDIKRDLWHASSTYSTMLGYASEASPIDRERWLERVHPDDRQNVVDKIDDVLRDSDVPYQYEARMLHADGSYQWVAVLGKVVESDPSGGASYLRGVRINITERKREEAVHAELEAQLRESQKIEAIGTLAGGIAHDFNNALATILGNVELAREDVGTNPLALESLEEIRKAGSRARDLAQQILSFSRRKPLLLVNQPLRPLVEEAVRLLRSTLPAGVDLVTSFADVSPRVLADSAQIQQIVLNLCTNAWHALHERFGRIELGLEEIVLDSAAVRGLADLKPGAHVRLRVSDNGRGMDAATRKRIFEPFFTTKPAGEGTGLGLAAVYGIVKTHKGAIVVESAPGRGATFWVYFPVATAPADQAQAVPAVPASLCGKGQRVLYLDDDESLVFLVTRMLNRLGYRTSGYQIARLALDAVRADPYGFDLVVTDLNMPGLSGLDAALELSRIRPDLPVVITSGYITDAMRTEALRAGVRDLIYKPDTAGDLCEAVARLALTVGEKSKSS